MYLTKKIFIKPGMRMSDLIFENPSLLLMLEHFDLDIVVRDKSVMKMCNENQISQHVFISIANLYNGFSPAGIEDFTESDTVIIIRFLRNSHRYYLKEKIPGIHKYIHELCIGNKNPGISLVERFFDEYLREVKDHLYYEDEIVFPYFNWLANDKKASNGTKHEFSAEEYRDHHTDIETKLGDLKKLLLQHIPSKNDRSLRRKLLLDLFELECDLNIHSLIEKSILIPLIRKIEEQKYCG